MPGGELERVLASIFGPDIARQAGGSLGDVDPGLIANTQQDPGLTYAGGPQPQRGGPAGAVSRAYNDLIDKVYGGIDQSKCPPWLTPECLDVTSRMLETTFRNFQLTARPPSHLAPPFPARCIDCFHKGISLPGDTQYSAADFVQLCCFTMPVGKWRGVVVDFGQALESLAAWDDVEWRVTINGTPHPVYNGIQQQLWDMVGHSKACHIHLLPRDTICLEAKSLSGTDHTAAARIFGWYYPVRAEVGGHEIRSTIVD